MTRKNNITKNMEVLILALLALFCVTLLLVGCSSENNDISTSETKQNNIKMPTSTKELLEISEAADRFVLSQSYESDKTLELNKEQIDNLVEEVQAFKKVSMLNPHGSGYPGYEITMYQDHKELLTIEIQDPVFARISDNELYFKGTENIWEMITEWLPMKETKPGTIEHLYNANKVEILLKSTNSIIEYNLEENPETSFRVTTLVRILDSAEAVEKSKTKDTDLQIELRFYFDDHQETIEVYEDYVLYEGTILQKENIGKTLKANIRAG